MKSSGIGPVMVSPNRSFICVEKIVRAMPAVKPMIMGYGMNLITTPSLKMPSSSRMMPAITVATARPSMPNWPIMPATMTMNAPVGPPICTLLPPSRETIKPPMMAVIRPFSGVTPLAIPKAMASGRATMPTMMPAMKSAANLLRS